MLVSDGKVSLETVTQGQIKAYLAYLMADKQMKPSSVNLTISALKSLYKGLLKKDIFTEIKNPKREKKLPVVLSKAEIKALISSIKNEKHKLMIEMMYGSGLRVSELVTLKVNDLDLDEGTGRITGKGKKDRNILIPKRMTARLIRYLSTRKHKSEYLFNIKENPLTTRLAQKIVKTAAKKANIGRNVFCHALRSSFATHLLESGTDIRIIQELLGHSDLGTTQIYTKVTTERIKKVKSPFDSL